MLYTRVCSAAVNGIQGQLIDVECDVANGLPQTTIVGLPDSAVRESIERVRAAIKNCGLSFPLGRITINLAPADLRKEGSAFELAIASGILICTGQLSSEVVAERLLIGELSLDGSLKPVAGVLPMVHAARMQGVKAVILPVDNVAEAKLIEGIHSIGIRCLADLVNVTNIQQHVSCAVQHNCEGETPPAAPLTDEPQFDDVRGQQHAKRALLIAAAGMHNIALIGPPGSAKTMLVRRLPSIMPVLDDEEALEVMKIYSVAGLWTNRTRLIRRRPFRAPHHTITARGLLGGGSTPKPGEASLAHCGILFLDELAEFPRHVLDVLRQPLEDRHVTISRAKAVIQYPTSFMLAATTNTWPCGYAGDWSGARRCQCSPAVVRRYLARLSGPLIDRIDMHVAVPRVPFDEIDDSGASGSSRTAEKSSANMLQRVRLAQMRQKQRYAHDGIYYNCELNGELLRRYCSLRRDSRVLLRQAFESLAMSARAYARVLKIARTIADLEAADHIETSHIAEAVQYRALDRPVS